MNNICEYCVHKGEMCMPVEYPCVDYAPRKDMKMSLEQALERNPFDEKIGNEKAYVRYLRYNVEGFYHKTSQEVYAIWKKVREND